MHLDVRGLMARGEDPFAAIMAAVAGLGPGEPLELVAPLDPVPLYAVLGAQGFDHESASLSGGDVRVVFHRPPSAGSD